MVDLRRAILGFEPLQPASSPQCEAVVPGTRLTHEHQCTNKAKFQRSGKRLCGRHASAAALAILNRIAQLERT